MFVFEIAAGSLLSVLRANIIHKPCCTEKCRNLTVFFFTGSTAIPCRVSPTCPSRSSRKNETQGRGATRTSQVLQEGARRPHASRRLSRRNRAHNQRYATRLSREGASFGVIKIKITTFVVAELDRSKTCHHRYWSIRTPARSCTPSHLSIWGRDGVALGVEDTFGNEYYTKYIVCDADLRPLGTNHPKPIRTDASSNFPYRKQPLHAIRSYPLPYPHSVPSAALRNRESGKSVP